ncbi:MAG TPA: alkaline phosphatase [Candidatus Rothia avistercoris]|uniref:Alkaline phosphatase n=1 Tax=Candidatus Rothia avistercoris TaxID=2840479 RepID=A0A9D2UG66_9MICC|nr:alkaline phosphatase [Candidatus Rothia avistercoris]
MSLSFRRTASCAAASLLLFTGTYAPAQAETATSTPKNVIVLIGDGMGYNYLDLYNAYNTGKVHYQVETGGDHKAISATLLNSAYSGSGFQSWNRLSMQTNWAEGPTYDSNVAWANFDWVKNSPTDSAAAGTAMATGVKTYNAGIGVDVNEQTVENLSERAKSLGKSAGVVSSVQYSHATPASFSAHSLSRNNYLEIANQQVYGNMDVVMGAGHPWYNNDHQKISDPSYRYISEADYTALSTGATDFTFVEDDDAFEKLTTGDTPDRVFGIAQVATTLQQARSDAATPNDVVDLPTMTQGALNVLDNNSEGFFLMVEGGAIDWTGHANQTQHALEEITDFFEAVDAVNAWVEQNSSWDETLVIVTADHETGYLMGDPEGGFNPMVPQGIGQYPTHSWNSGDHTNMLVPFFSKGAGATELEAATVGRDQVHGRYLDNTSLANWLLDTKWVASAEPAPTPTEEPTAETTVAPTADSSATSTAEPTAQPTSQPTAEPTSTPSTEPSASAAPSQELSAEPTASAQPANSAQPTSSVQQSTSAAALTSGADTSGTDGVASSSTKPSKGVLASTGASVAALALGALALLGLGALALTVQRKKRSS